MARNAALAAWEVNDPWGRPLRLYRPTRSTPYLSATWYEPGVERQQRTTLGTDEADARRWCVDKATRLQRAQRRRRPDRPLQAGRALVEEYLNPDNQPDWDSTRTRSKARNLTRRFVDDRLLALPCEHWSTEDLRRVLLDAAGEGLARSYLQDVRNMLSGLVRVGVDLGYLDPDQITMASVRVPKAAGRTRRSGRPGAAHRRDVDHDDGFTFRVERRHLPAPERIHDLAAHLPRPYDTLVLLAAHSGLRWGEAIALRPGDIDQATRTIAVHRAIAEDTDGTLTEGLPKGRKRRMTFYPDVLAADIARLCDDARHDDDARGRLLFPSRTGCTLRRSNWNRRYWRPAHTAAGWEPEWTFHTLRHAAAVWMIYDLGSDLHDVADVLGHADVTVTQRVYVQAREGVAARLAALSA